MIGEWPALDLFPWFCFLLLQDLSILLGFFVSIFVFVLKSPIHSQKSSKHIKLEEIITSQDGKCDIWVSKLLIRNSVICANLVEIKMSDFDVILRIDWLNALYTIIDCRRKRVLFSLRKAKSFEFQGTPHSLIAPTISALRSWEVAR